MKTILKITGLLAILIMLAACNHGNNTPSSTEKFTKTKVFNPNTAKVKLISVANNRAADEEEVCEVEPLKSKDVDLGDEHSYYFTDANGNKIADLSKGDSGNYYPVYLELNEPKDNKEYMLLNQYKTATVLETYTRPDNNNQMYDTYSLFLYEIVGKDDLDAYKYDDNTYIRIYPSANYWFDSEGYASNKIGTKITYDDAFKNNFTNLSDKWVAWGWSTYNEELDTWFCHRVISRVLSPKDGNTYTVKTIGDKYPISFINPTQKSIKIYNAMHNPIFTVAAGATIEQDLYLQYPYYYMDGNDKVTIEIKNENCNFILRLERPVSGKKYMCLDQYKGTSLEEITGNNNRYYFFLFEVVDKDSENCFEYAENVYIREYPSAYYNINDASFISTNFGKEIVYTDTLFNQFETTQKWANWGWSTEVNGKRYCHFCIASSMSKK